MFLVIGIFCIIFTAILLFSEKIFTPKISSILPANNLEFFLEISEKEKIADFLSVFPQHLRKISDIFSKIQFDKFTDFSEKRGLAIFSNSFFTEKNSDYFVIFAKISNSKKAEDFVKNLPAANLATEFLEDNQKILRFSGENSYDIFFFNGWLFLTSDQNFFPKILEVKNQFSPSLETNPKFLNLLRKVENYSISFFAKSNFFKSETFFSENFSEKIHGFEPIFLDFFPRFSGGISKKNEKIVTKFFFDNVRHFGNFSNENEKKFGNLYGNLENLHPIFIFSGQQIANRIEDIFNFFEQYDPAFSFFLRGKVRKKLQEIFSNDFSLEYDFWPFLENDFLFAIFENNASQENPYFLVTGILGDEIFSKEKFKKFCQIGRKNLAKFFPKLEIHNLPDGTEIKEIVGCEECITENFQKFPQDDKEFSFLIGENENEKNLLGIWREKNQIAFSNSKEILENFFTNSHQINQSEISNISFDLPSNNFWNFSFPFKKIDFSWNINNEFLEFSIDLEQ